MRYINFLILVFTVLVSTVSCAADKNPVVSEPAVKKEAATPDVLPYKAGETIQYNIKSLGVKAGEASLTFKGLVKDPQGRDSYLIVFTAKAANFLDEEKIYADVATFYPRVVERNLNIWGKKEKITESYNPQTGMVEVVKSAGGKTTTQAIQAKAPVDNIYCFIYRYRRSGDFKIGDSFAISLPTAQVKIDLLKMTKLKTGGRLYDAYYMQSDPVKYKVWFDTSDKRIPLRINGAVGISDTAMTMSGYEEGK